MGNFELSRMKLSNNGCIEKKKNSIEYNRIKLITHVMSTQQQNANCIHVEVL